MAPRGGGQTNGFIRAMIFPPFDPARGATQLNLSAFALLVTVSSPGTCHRGPGPLSEVFCLPKTYGVGRGFSAAFSAIATSSSDAGSLGSAASASWSDSDSAYVDAESVSEPLARG